MLYKLNKTENKDTYEKVKRVTLKDLDWREKDLEKLISNNLQDFIYTNDLMPIFTERDYKEEPDIIALDSKGDMYIFELKRWGSKEENLLQVLRYGQLFGRSNYDELNEMYGKYIDNKQGADLATDHARYFGKSEGDAIKNDDFNQNQHFIVITNGLDQGTIESIIYWKKYGLNIDAIVYWVFKIAKDYYIEFNMYSQIDDFLEYENNCYVLNTNSKNDPNCDKEMLSEGKAAAYNTGWKEKIKKLQKDDWVFLYRSGEGIVAYGKADGKLNKKDRYGVKEYEYNMNLNSFSLVDPPISAAEMKKIAGYGFNFRQTLFSISEEAANKIRKAAQDGDR